ncbi:MAG: lipoyl protein ligase domain-containing protein [Planctomycetota bacterium]
MATTIPETRLVAWWDEPAPGPENMAADEVLADEAVATGGLLVRLYGWSEPAVSLGGFQRLAEATSCPAIAGLPIVRRPSGGGAILHGSDLTYAVAVPRDHAWGGDPQVLYDAFHESLAAELRHRGVAAALHAGSDRAAGDEGRLFCFDRRARGDLVVRDAGHDPDGHKILGSAQRRLRGAVLQHGSLLTRSLASVAAPARHPGLVELHPAAAGWDLRELVGAWLERVAAAAASPLEIRPESFGADRSEAIVARAPRFREAAWLARR